MANSSLIRHEASGSHTPRSVPLPQNLYIITPVTIQSLCRVLTFQSAFSILYPHGLFTTAQTDVVSPVAENPSVTLCNIDGFFSMKNWPRQNGR